MTELSMCIFLDKKKIWFGEHKYKLLQNKHVNLNYEGIRNFKWVVYSNYESDTIMTWTIYFQYPYVKTNLVAKNGNNLTPIAQVERRGFKTKLNKKHR